MESMNPSGTGKDRAVQYMLREAKKHPNYGPNVSIIEGTSGSTGIALAFQCNALLGAQNTDKSVTANTTSKTDASSNIGILFQAINVLAGVHACLYFVCPYSLSMPHHL